MQIISDFGTYCCFNFFASDFLSEWFCRCFSLFWRGQFYIKSFIIELILLIPIGIFLYQMFLKGYIIGCKWNCPDFSIPTGLFDRCFWNSFTRHLSDCVSNIFSNCSWHFWYGPLCLVFVIPLAETMYDALVSSFRKEKSSILMEWCSYLPGNLKCWVSFHQRVAMIRLGVLSPIHSRSISSSCLVKLFVLFFCLILFHIVSKLYPLAHL